MVWVVCCLLLLRAVRCLLLFVVSRCLWFDVWCWCRELLLVVVCCLFGVCRCWLLLLVAVCGEVFGVFVVVVVVLGVSLAVDVRCLLSVVAVCC